MSRPYAEVIGDPIAHSKSPLIHNFWLGRLGIDAEYRACHVRPGELAGYIAARRADPDWRGCNVTIPHKEAIVPLLDSVGRSGGKVGAINTVWRDEKDGLRGANTDVDGVREALRGIDPGGRTVVVIGAGGAARAAFAHLEGLGCASVRVLARNADKARATLGDFDLPADVAPFEAANGTFAGASLVINATQLGMAGQAAMPRFVLDELAEMESDALVFDMVYAPRETGLIQRAAMLGIPTSGGLVMLVGQARTAFARFFGQQPDKAWDLSLQALLTQ